MAYNVKHIAPAWHLSAADAALRAQQRPQRLGGHVETAVVAPTARLEPMKIQSRRVGFGTECHPDDEPGLWLDTTALMRECRSPKGRARSEYLNARGFIVAAFHHANAYLVFAWPSPMLIAMHIESLAVGSALAAARAMMCCCCRMSA